MLESIMLIALGFLTATLFALIALQFVWRRAVKVTTRKLTSDLDLDELKASADEAASLNISLRDKRNEIATLTGKNAQLEESLATARQEHEAAQAKARQEIDDLNRNITELQSEHATLQAEAETRLNDLKVLQSHVDGIDAALRSDFEKRGMIETKLKALGTKTLQLLEEMNSAVSDFGDARNIQALLDTTPKPTETPAASEAPAKLTPLVLDEEDEAESSDVVELEEIKASLDQHTDIVSTDVAPAETKPSTEVDDEDTATSETYIADRIRALEAGVNAPA